MLNFVFGFSGSEIALLGIVALVLIGPRDMPTALRAIARVLRQGRQLAGEFQHHMDAIMREVEISDEPASSRDLRDMNLQNGVSDALDPRRGETGTRAMPEPTDVGG
jgi:sec-independent protein translocase protein TatB